MSDAKEACLWTPLVPAPGIWTTLDLFDRRSKAHLYLVLGYMNVPLTASLRSSLM